MDDLFFKYHTKMLRFAFRHTGDFYTAEDICQEAFLRLTENLHRVSDADAFSWLREVTRNLITDHGRKRRILIEFPEQISSPSGDVSELLIRKEAHQRRCLALKELEQYRPDWHSALLLSELYNMENPAISSILGVTPGLVSQWKHRGRNWLRMYLEKDSDSRRGDLF